MAVAGLITESMGAAITGMSNWNASICQLRLTCLGSRVRRDGTTAMSSKEYARRPRLPRPISISLLTGTAYRPSVSVERGRVNSMSWLDATMVGFDTETTGISTERDRIVTAAI